MNLFVKILFFIFTMFITVEEAKFSTVATIPQGKIVKDRIYGEQVSDFQFTDIDGVQVIVSLNVDNEGNLFELDIWKTDFGKLISYPEL